MMSFFNNVNKIVLLLIFLPGTVIGQSLIDVPSNPHKAPLYWSVYEYHITKEINGQATNYIPEDVFLKNINFVEQHLKPYGYKMVAIDGWGDEWDSSTYNENGYRSKHSRHWNNDYAWWANELQSRGMNLGIYQNPLWVNLDAVKDGLLVKGTSIPLSAIIDTTETTKWFTWVQVDSTGAEEYVKGYVQHFADMGVKYLRVDFLSWFEDGYDKNEGTVGPNRSQQDYIKAMSWIKEACDANNMLFSAVMPALNNEAEVEIRYAHMFRVNEDVYTGEWSRFSEFDRGVRRNYWSQYANTFDGYTYWSYLAGRNKIILDGDFIRLNTMANDEEKKTVISLHLMAGGPLTPSDQYDTIGENLKFYQNKEMLALNEDGFVGKPLNNDPTNTNSQIWKGQMSDGDWIVALFNRENSAQTRSIDFSTELGLSSAADVRDLWEHSDLGSMSSYSESIPAHGVTVLRIGDLSDNDSSYTNTGSINIGSDDASNYDTWENNSDDGSGFSSWIFGGNAASRSGLASSQNNGGSSSIDTEGKSFYLSDADGSGSYVDVFRYLIQDLQPGQTFTIQMDVNWRAGYKGINIRGADDNTSIFKFEIGNQGSGDDHVVKNAATGNGSIGNGYSDNTQFTIELSQTSEGGGTWTINRSGGITDSDTGTYSGTVSSIQLYTFLAGSDAQQAIYYNNLGITNTSNSVQLTGSEGWRLLSIPVSGQTYENVLSPIWTQGIPIGADSDKGTPNVYLWDINSTGSSNSHWVPIQSLQTPVNPGTGFLVYVYDDDNFDGVGDGFPKTLTLSGTESDIDVSPTLNPGDSAWTLIGNPFSTPMDFDEATKSQITDVAYVWNPNTNSWISWNGTVGDITDGILKPYQGFFVQNGTLSGENSITFSSSKSSGGTFYGKEVADSQKYFKLKIGNGSIENSLWVQLSNQGKIIEKIKGDAAALEPLQAPYVVISAQKQSDQLDIIHVPSNAENMYSIPLNIRSTEGGKFTLSVEAIQLEDQSIYLEDALTGSKELIVEGLTYLLDISEVERRDKGLKGANTPVLEAQTMGSQRFKLVVNPSISVGNELEEIPEAVSLNQNYPNPFNPSTTLSYSIKEMGKVTLEVFSVEGRKIAELVNARQQPGNYTIVWNASEVSSGIYFYRLTSGGVSITKKMTLLK